jgi:DNA-3-methyladenine glycosylase
MAGHARHTGDVGQGSPTTGLDLEAGPLDTEARLDPAFFARDALVVARALVGTFLVRHAPEAEGGPRVVRIVETEAYRGPKDLACHARAGLTKRTRILFGPPGRAYVFLIYGMYDCFNVVAHAEGKGHAILVRAGEPIAGIAPGVRTDGPGRVTRALGITRDDNDRDLRGDELYLLPRRTRPSIVAGPRVGVGYAGSWAEKPWRFCDRSSVHASRPSAKTIGLGLGAVAAPRARTARRS